VIAGKKAAPPEKQTIYALTLIPEVAGVMVHF
jgi:hypothetical protein